MTSDCEIRTGVTALKATIAGLTEARADLVLLGRRIETIVADADAVIASGRGSQRLLAVEPEPITGIEAGPVIEMEAEPVAEVEAEPRRRVEAEPVAEIEAESVAEIEAEPVAEVEAEPVAETEAEPVAEIEAEPVAEIEAEPVAEIEAEPIAETESAEPVAEVEVEPVAETEAEPVAEVEAEPVAEIEVERVAETEAEPVAEVEVEPVAMSTVAEAVAAAVDSSEQLTLIRGLDAGAAAKLNCLGICRFADIAALTADDIAEITAALGEDGRIGREGWIEQASLLARGVETAHVRQLRGSDAAAPIWQITSAHSGNAPIVPDSSAGHATEAAAVVIEARVAAETAIAAASPVGTPPHTPSVVDLAAARALRQARPRPHTLSRLAGRVATVTLFLAFAAVAWTGIEMADGNWQALSTLINGVKLGPLASLM
ncbi:MAG: hypothetical protein R3D27_03755 [Hyphomicrobiaceae bacterium]